MIPNVQLIEPNLSECYQADAAIFAMEGLNQLSTLTGEERYKKAERETLKAIVSDNLDMRADSQILVNNCTWHKNAVNAGTIEAFYELMKYTDEFLES